MLIDFHAHILPGCDHGSDSLETSMNQLRMAKEAGITTVVATPHFYMYHDTVDSFINRREHSYRMLIDATESVDLGMNIVKAAEVTLYIDLPSLEDLNRLCIEGTNCMLLELPGYRWSVWTAESLSQIIQGRNIIPVIAHIDRYDAHTVRRLIELKIPLQLNASALIPFSRRSKYMRMIREGAVHLLGSDAHNSADEYKDFARAVKILGSQMDAMNRNAGILLDGESIFEKAHISWEHNVSL